MIEIALKGKAGIGGLGRVSYKVAESLENLGFKVKLHALDVRIPTYYISDLYFSYLLSKRLANRSILIGWLGQNFFSSKAHEGRYFAQCGDFRAYIKNLAPEFTSFREKIHELLNDIGYGIYDPYRFELARADKILALSNFVKQQLSVFNHTLEKKAIVYQPGVDEEIFDYKKTASEYFLFVGWVSRRKGILDLLKAIYELKKRGKNTKLVLTGSGRWDDVFKLVKSYGIQENVKILGYVTDAELHDIYTKAVCLILPSYSEGFGIPALEAMSIAVPAIVSENVGSKDVVREGNAGIVIEAGNVNQLISSMIKFLENPELSWSMGSRGRKIARKYTWIKNTERFVKEAKISEMW